MGFGLVVTRMKESLPETRFTKIHTLNTFYGSIPYFYYVVLLMNISHPIISNFYISAIFKTKQKMIRNPFTEAEHLKEKLSDFLIFFTTYLK